MILNYMWTNIGKAEVNYEVFNVVTQEENIVDTEEINYDEAEDSLKISNETIEKPQEGSAINEVIKKTNEQIGTISIPTFNLTAPVAEGTTKEIMDEYVGHFENTSLWDGNIGLAAHNRGYPVNYFANIKDLQIGDEIIYKVGDKSRTYLVNEITIIEDTDWSYLQETNDNRITLITCVENEPSYRRCIQGIEKK